MMYTLILMRKKALLGFLFGVVSISTSSVYAAQSCDLNMGKKIFTKCAACHSLIDGQHLMGPSLHGLINRKSASAKGFSYSPAMIAHNKNWTKENLDHFLTKPASVVPETTMPFAGLRKEKHRKAVICFIEQANNASNKKV